jgi:hypothetical protein
MKKAISVPTVDELLTLVEFGNLDQLKDALSVLHLHGIAKAKYLPALGKLLATNDSEVLRLTLGIMMNFEQCSRGEFEQLKRYLPEFHQLAATQFGALALIVALSGPAEELVPKLRSYLCRFPEEGCDLVHKFGPVARGLVPDLIELLESDEWDDIWAAIDAIWAIGPAAAAAVPMLEKLTKHESGVITGRACIALEKITGKSRESWPRGPNAT